MTVGVRVPHPIDVLHSGGVALACGLDGQILADEPHGLFAADTRVLSTYRIAVGGQAWRQLGRTRSGQATAVWQFQNPPMRDPAGELEAGTLVLSLRRRLAAQLFLGLVPDAPRGRCFLDPWLPEWLPRLEVRGLRVGNGRMDVGLARQGAGTVVEHLRADGVTVVQDTMEAPIWGAPPTLAPGPPGPPAGRRLTVPGPSYGAWGLFDDNSSTTTW